MSATPQSADPIVERAQARVGMVLNDKWRLDRLLGIGGMAAVYAATHRNQKRVAVKMLHAEVSGDAEVRTRFLREGYAANAIEHDGAVSVLDDDVAPDGSAFLVMELLDGETLEQRWERKGNRLELGELLLFVDQLLDVLAAAHAKEIVHRDIKPENLFVTRAGQLKVLDFGVARVFEGRQSSSPKTSTRVGTVMGTPAFMAPEQARARWDEVDGRTDLWAVGATMFTLLSGSFVHEAETGNEQLIYSATRPARSIASVVTGLPRSVVATIDRALQFERDQRWSDARAMQQAVRGSLEALRMQGAAPTIGQRSTFKSIPEMAAVTVHEVSRAPTQATQSMDWAEERDRQAIEVERLRPAANEARAGLDAVKKKVADVQARLAAAREERKSLEAWFARQVGTRTAEVEEARKLVRTHLSDIARRAITQTGTYGGEFDEAREDIKRLTRASEARARDVELHEMALEAYDHTAFKRGIVLAAAIAAIVFLLFVSPIVWWIAKPAPPPELPAAPAVS